MSVRPSIRHPLSQPKLQVLQTSVIRQKIQRIKTSNHRKCQKEIRIRSTSIIKKTAKNNSHLNNIRRPFLILLNHHCHSTIVRETLLKKGKTI